VADWRRLLINAPARIADAAWLGYLVILAAGSLGALVTALLWLILWLAGYPLP
jgi:hypothetical protein